MPRARLQFAPHNGASALTHRSSAFEGQFVALFQEHYPRVARILDRLTGEPDAAADLAQEAFVRLYKRGELPDAPIAWLVTVAFNLFRNSKNTGARRLRLMTVERGTYSHSDPAPAADAQLETTELQPRVRRVLDALPERERQLLLLRAEGYSYRDLAIALDLQETSVGVLLARAKRAFKERYEGQPDAS